MDSIYTYSDYRKFLADYFAEKKAKNKNFTHRYFARKAGFRAPNFLHLVMNGKRNLAKEGLTKMSLAIGLDKNEMEYLENLVFFTQSKSIKEKSYYYQRLNDFRQSRFVQPINQDQFEFYSSWIHLAVREVACFSGRPVSEKEIAKQIVPRVPPVEVKKSLELLLRLGMLKKEKSGSYSQSSRLLSTGDEVGSLAIANYHVSTMSLAAESIERFDPDQRDISAVTVGVTKKNAEKIKRKIQKFRKEILELANEDNPEVVYQFNLQLFPLSRPNDQ